MKPLSYEHAEPGGSSVDSKLAESTLDFDFADVLVDDSSDLYAQPLHLDAIGLENPAAIADFAYDADFSILQSQPYLNGWQGLDLNPMIQFEGADDFADLDLHDLLNSDAIADTYASDQDNSRSGKHVTNNSGPSRVGPAIPQSKETQHILQRDQRTHTVSSSAPRIIPSPNTRKRKRSRVRFAAESLKALQEWLDEHESDPYPSIEVKRQLSSQTGLSIKQISTWFTNSRRRQLSPDVPNTDATTATQPRERPSVDVELDAAGFKVPHHPISSQRSSSPNDPVTPLLPQYLGNTWPDTSNKFKCLDFPPCMRGFDTQEALTQHIQDHLLGEEDGLEAAPDSFLGFESLRSLQSFRSVSSVGSAFSQCSHAVMSGPPRRGRRRRPVRQDSTAPSQTPSSFRSTGDAVVYYCTFCGKEMHAKTWKRHEETQHLPRHQWTCMLNGYRTQVIGTDNEACIFCGEEEPADTHRVACHRIDECLETPNRDRTFQRKDHLAQHLKNFHNFPNLSDDLAKDWHTEVDYSQQRWRCGFCNLVLRTWNERAKHVAKHFRQGATMVDWDANRDDLISSIDASRAVAVTKDIQPSTSVDRETDGSLAATLQRTTLTTASSALVLQNKIESLSTCKIRIGSWQRTARTATDLKVFYESSNSILYYYTMSDCVGYRMEIPFSTIQTLSLHTTSEHTSTRDGIKSEFEGVVIKLRRAPLFTRSFPELGTFEPCDDFTKEQQASSSLKHYLYGNSNILAGQLAKLMALDQFQKRHQEGTESSQEYLSRPDDDTGDNSNEQAPPTKNVPTASATRAAPCLKDEVASSPDDGRQGEGQ